ncbi:MAG: hypothetical protein FWD69_10555 [Polyangiaceae bacterium]|nr:hypothetical protein [Polyangiaceae bacterium]
MKRVLFALCMVDCACAASTGPAERAEIGTTAAQIEVCQEVGRACKADGGTDCYDKYDACMTDGGLR